MTLLATVDGLPLRHLRRGKVREVYEVDATRLLIVATDRVSAFDVVMRQAIPFKGAVLTQLTAWWLRVLESEVEHHLVTADARRIVDAVPALEPHLPVLRGRSMLCRRTDVFPIECVMRGYLAGSAWKEYQSMGTLAGEPLPAGLVQSERLDPPRFSPATKAESGHDENIPRAAVAAQIGMEAAAMLEQASQRIYTRARDVAAARGLILADTKLEFGRASEGRVLLIDEVLTPDSSRYWDATAYVPGAPQPSFDKQPLRDWLDDERRAGRWDGDAPPPDLPDALVLSTSERYLDVFRRITGTDLELLELS